MARKAAKKTKNNNKNASHSAARPSPAKPRVALKSKVKTAAKAGKPTSKTAKKAARPPNGKLSGTKASVAKAVSRLKAKKADRTSAPESAGRKAPKSVRSPRSRILTAAKAVLSSVADTAKDALNLAVANTIATTAVKSTPRKAVASPGSALTGAVAPDFKLPRDGGGTVSLADFAGKNLVLFFYPRADTPGCTREAMDFTRLSGAFTQVNTAVLGVSADPVKAQNAFRDKHHLGIPLVSDETHALLNAYGVWGEKSMYGKIFMGIIRTTVLIGADGRIAKIWSPVSVDGHADEVLATAKGL